MKRSLNFNHDNGQLTTSGQNSPLVHGVKRCPKVTRPAQSKILGKWESFWKIEILLSKGLGEATTIFRPQTVLASHLPRGQYCTTEMSHRQ